MSQKKLPNPMKELGNYMVDLFKNQIVVCVRLLNLHSSTTVV